jgi:putative ABC transport system permease protein
MHRGDEDERHPGDEARSAVTLFRAKAREPLFELRLALRGLRRDWAFTLVTVAILALAIGLNVTVFTVMHAMLFRGNPLAARSDRLAYIEMRKPLAQAPEPIRYSDFEAWRLQAHAFQGLAFAGTDRIIPFRAGHARAVDTRVSHVSANTFSLLGVQPILGRDFVPADGTPGAAPVAILSHRFWESRLSKRTDIIGSIVSVDGKPVTVIGVMPEGFAVVYERNFWMPLVPSPPLALSVFGRLRDGVTHEEARAEIDTINRRLAMADPAADRDVVISVSTYSQAHTSPDAPMIYGSLWAGGWLVLIVACANVTNLALVRTIGQRRELATRMALGAEQVRIIRPVLIEWLMLGGMSAGFGWLLTTVSVGTWAQATASRYLALDYTQDGGTVVYLLAVSGAAAMLCSMAPIVTVAQLSVGGALTADARGATQGLRDARLGAALVACQMALAVVLLAGAGVLVRSLVTIVGAETGVRDPARVLVGAVLLPSDRYPIDAPTSRLAVFDHLLARLKTIPGIEDASVASSIPVDSGISRTFEIEGRPSVPPGGERAQFLSVGSTYFRVVGVSALAGREFNDDDRLAARPVAIVNDSFVATFLPGGHALGTRLRAHDRDLPGEWRTVIGVVPNIMQGDPLRQQFKPLVYVPFRQEPAARARKSGGTGFNGVNFLLRTSVPLGLVGEFVRAEVHRADPDVLLEDFGTLRDSFTFDRDRMDLEHADLGKYAALAPVLAASALLLAAIGLFAVITHSVAQRTKEIGVRMAIGARAGDISRMVLRDGLFPVALGLSIGVAMSFAVNRGLQSQLVGVSAYDPVTMAGAPVGLITVALVACWIPARRAMHVDPVVALRHE